MSAGPPAGNGTTRVNGLLGKACARAVVASDGASDAAPSPASALRRESLIFIVLRYSAKVCARAISTQMEPRPHDRHLSHRPAGAVPSEWKCAHGRYVLQQAYSVRPIPAGRNMFYWPNPVQPTAAPIASIHSGWTLKRSSTAVLAAVMATKIQSW